jgi:hypothetical protein
MGIAVIRTVELGPWLGRLVTPPEPPTAAEALLSEVRLQLLTAVFGRTEWLTAWQAAVPRAASLVATDAESRIRHASPESRFPARRLRQILPTEEDREILLARLSAAGIGLETVVGRLASRQMGALADTQERSTRELEDAGHLRMICGELEVAWDRLVRTANEELARADRVASEVRQWKRPLAPLLLGSTLLLGAATWVGLVLGGYVSAPGWFLPVAEWVWSW